VGPVASADHRGRDRHAGQRAAAARRAIGARPPRRHYLIPAADGVRAHRPEWRGPSPGQGTSGVSAAAQPAQPQPDVTGVPRRAGAPPGLAPQRLLDHQARRERVSGRLVGAGSPVARDRHSLGSGRARLPDPRSAAFDRSPNLHRGPGLAHPQGSADAGWVARHAGVGDVARDPWPGPRRGTVRRPLLRQLQPRWRRDPASRPVQGQGRAAELPRRLARGRLGGQPAP
jgi:hypothetical protein